MSVQSYNDVNLPHVKKLDIKFNSPNVPAKTGNEIKEQLAQNQPPLGSQFNSYLLNSASNYWTLDPFQYSVTKFKYSGIENEPGAVTEGNSTLSPLDGLNKVSVVQADFKNSPGLIYNDVKLDAGYRLDLVVNNSVIIEIKSVEELAPIHKAQLLTYLKLSKIKLGLLLNFNTIDLKEGIQRLIM